MCCTENWSRRGRGRRAITIVEVLLACVLFAGIATSLASVWIMHFRAIDQAQNLLAASAIGDSVLNTQAGMGFTVHDVAGNVTVVRAIDGTATPYVYHWDVKVQDMSGGSPGIKIVKVTVTYFDNSTIQKSLSMVTYVYWAG